MIRQIIVFLLLISGVAFAETRYFDQYNKEVTREQYQKIVAEWNARLFPPAPATTVTPAPETTAAPAENTPMPIAEIPKDSYGRPLRDSKGRWITYPGNEGAGSTMRGQYSTSSLPELDMTKDVHVKGHWRTNQDGTKSWVRTHTRSK